MQRSTATVSRRQAHVVGVFGLVGLGLGPGCGDDSGATSHTAGPTTTTSPEAHGEPTTKGESGPTGDPSTSTGDPTTGDTTYEELETPPPGPDISLFDHLEGSCQTCGIRPDGTMECWKVPRLGSWEEECGGELWFNPAPGLYKSILGVASLEAYAIDELGQRVSWRPAKGEDPYIFPRFAAGGLYRGRRGF